MGKKATRTPTDESLFGTLVTGIIVTLVVVTFVIVVSLAGLVG